MSAFDIAPENFLGHQYSQYISKLQQTALSNPAEYFKMKRLLIERVKTGMTKTIFTDISTLLKAGTINGSHVFESTVGSTYAPAYPSQRVNQVCLSACETLDKLLDEVVDILMPPDITKILGDKLEKQGRATFAPAP
jgi:hypothetical protein